MAYNIFEENDDFLSQFKPTEEIDNFDFLNAPGIVNPQAPEVSEIERISQPDAVTQSYQRPQRGAFEAITYASETPTPEIQMQKDYVAARHDANISATAYEDSEDVYRAPSGYTYEKPKESQWNDAMLGMLGWMSGFLVNGNTGEGMQGAFSAVAENENRAHRFKQVDYLESQGYNPKDIDSFIRTGDYKSLVKNKAAWQAAGAGIIFNPSTGEYKRLTGAGGTSGRIIDKTVDLGDRVLIQYADGTKEEQPKGDKPSNSSDFQVIPGTGYRFNKRTGESSPIPQSGDIGLDSEFAEDGVGDSGLIERGGVFYEQKRDKLGNKFYEVAKNQKVLKESKDANRPTASDTQVYDITQRITNASDSDLSPITGYGAQFIGDTGRSVVSRLAPGETNSLRLDIENMKQTMTNAAVQMATKAGQSGINIQSEVDRLAKAFDRMDYSSPEALRRSVAETQELYNNLSRTYQQKVEQQGSPVAGSERSGSFQQKYKY